MGRGLPAALQLQQSVLLTWIEWLARTSLVARCYAPRIGWAGDHWGAFDRSPLHLSLVPVRCILAAAGVALPRFPLSSSTPIDLWHRLILNGVVYPAILFTLLVRLLSPRPGVLNALLGGAVGLVLFLVVMLARHGALGAGDVKLAAFIGVVGFSQALWALALGILAGGVGALFMLITRRGGLKSYISYAPFLCLGAMLVLLYSPLLPTA